MVRLLVFLSTLYLGGCLQPMEGPQAEKVDKQVQCGFGSSGC
ncbi:hypothetical protein [Helicobacter bizzozeronii]|uniref:Uncharacterized protein n=1 Tax=Helicobacter bizzozeronii (strain CIII-1) TaxID=1002804 RepID=F8KSF3_HELBC|nr:hypothetical protein [Helicobacter bizzozeronii]CCB79722.1 hypothetical protein HBZC1_07360 [Helicobacter bizzozeronii CIII-1]